MRRTLLLAAAVGSVAMLATPASASDYRPHHRPVTTSFLGIFVSPAPKVVHHHPRPVYLHPQPVYRYVRPLPQPRWHYGHGPQVRHFDRRHDGHAERRAGHHDWHHDRPQLGHGRAERRDGGHDRQHGNERRGGSGRDHARNDRGRH